MSTSMIGAAGGLSAEDREKLVPENLREGVTLFEGTSKEVVGNLLPADDLDLLASIHFQRGGFNATVRFWNGSSYSNVDAQYGSATVRGTIKKVIILETGGGNICGHSGVGVYTSGHTSTISGLSDVAQSFAVLGMK